MKRLKKIIKSNRLLSLIYRFFYRFTSTLFWNIVFLWDKLSRGNVKYCNCFVFTTVFGKIKKNNWGDDLNVYFFKKISSAKLRFVPFDQLFFSPKLEKYSLIGSIIGDFDLDNTIIFGSGAITSNPKIVGTPKKILSVRGPLTREVLLNKGISCPTIYGDPALMLPLVYSPNTEKEDIIGIIPHYRTLNSKWITDAKKNNKVMIIDMSKYEKWTDIIDLIFKCKIIISESLHGLIVSETYGIPSVWIEIASHNCPWEWEFKFKDFYNSIGKNNPICYKIYEGYGMDELIKIAKEWTPGKIDYDAMLRAFPFEIKGELLK